MDYRHLIGSMVLAAAATWAALAPTAHAAPVIVENGEMVICSPTPANYFVERGGTLSATSSAEATALRSEGGAVSIASGATLSIDIGSGTNTYYLGGGLAGTGAFEKAGAGSLAVSGVNNGFAGTVKASGGTLSFRPVHATPKFTYYRLVLMSLEGMVDNNLELAELALYDIVGERINIGLTRVSEPEWSSTNLLPGTYSKFGEATTDGMSTSAANLFDGKPGTIMSGYATRTSNKTYWIYLNMRLPESSDVAPAFYNIAFGRTDRAPKSWMLQGSDDHATWFTLDKRDADAVADIKPSSNNSWCNDGIPLPLVWEGDNAPVGEVDAKWFRFTVKAVGGTGQTRQISELSLYDMQGKRLNVGLTSMGLDYSGTLPAGSFSWHYQYSGSYAGVDTHEDKMFDEDIDTRFQAQSLNYQNLAEGAVEVRWHKWTMRLADDAPPVASYNFAPYDPSIPSSYPANWLVEASRDGTTWFQVDARSGDAATSLFPETRGYCNNGHPIGFTSGFDRTLAPTGAVVAVANGARLEFPASTSCANSVSGLAADLTAEGVLGTIVNFNPAASGVLHLTYSHSPRLEDTALPIVFNGVEKGANLENWTVVANGTPDTDGLYSMRFDENDLLRVTKKPTATILSFR